MRRTLTVIAIAALVGAGIAAPAQATGVVVPASDPVAGSYVVVLKDSAGTASTADVKKKVRSGKVKETYKNTIKGFSVKTTPAEAARLAGLPGVKAVYEDSMAYPDDAGATPQVVQTIPKPPNSYWGLNSIDQRTVPSNTVAGTYQWVYSGAGQRVYIIDSGLQFNHTQFTGRIAGSAFITGLGSANDCNGHGTHVAGTIAGSTYGVAKNVQIFPVRVFGCTGGAPFSDIIAAVDFATGNSPKPGIINMSLGGGKYQPMNDAVNRAADSGMTVVVAAGNDGQNACNYSPASATSAITVGSTGNFQSSTAPISNARSTFSNYGQCVDIFAPGANIRSAWWGSSTAANTISGTSMATPHVAGVVALYRQKAPTSWVEPTRDFIVDFSKKGHVTSAGTGSPNRLLYAGNIPTLTANGSPEPITCTRNITVSGNLALLGVPVPGATVEIWYNRAGPTGPAFKGTATTNSSGNYSRVVSQANDGTWYAIYRGAPLIGSKTSAADTVLCTNRS